MVNYNKLLLLVMGLLKKHPGGLRASVDLAAELVLQKELQLS